MNMLDGAFVVVLLLAALGGWRFGFVARVLAWGGIADRAPRRLPLRSEGRDVVRRHERRRSVTVAVLFLVLAATLGQTAGFGVGLLAHRSTRTPRALPTWDRAAGAAVGVLGVVVVTWVLAPALTFAKGWTAREARGSTVLGVLDDVSPEQPPQFAALGRTISDAPYPSVLSPIGQPPDHPPPRSSGIMPSVNARIERSTVLVRSDACGRDVRGTGWVAGPGLIVTNAHVVAGERTTTIEDNVGREHEADLVLFDPKGDLALLRVGDFDAPALRLADPVPGQTGAAYGHPGGGALVDTPALVGTTSPTDVSNMYGPGYVSRSVLTFRGRIVAGYSGGPLVNGTGRVVGVVFAVSAAHQTVSYAIPTDQYRGHEHLRAREPSTGPQWRVSRPMTDDGMSIRRAAPPDSAAVSDVWLRSRHASYPAIPLPVHEDEDVREWFAAVVLPTREVWVAEVDDQVVALLVLEADWVDQLYVDPDWTGRGLGGRLLDVAKAERPAGLDLWAFQSNTGARRFYERHGFAAVAMTDGDNEEGAPDVRYRWPGAERVTGGPDGETLVGALWT